MAMEDSQPLNASTLDSRTLQIEQGNSRVDGDDSSGLADVRFRHVRRHVIYLASAVFVVLLIALVAVGLAVRALGQHPGVAPPYLANDVALTVGDVINYTSKRLIQRIAFGSCTAHDNRPQDIWTKAVIPAQPDAWIWTGDMAYMDNAAFECNAATATSPACRCEADWLRQPPWGCAAGVVDNARDKMMSQLQDDGYVAFLQFMCPDHLQRGAFPPPGMDADVCTRPIMGVYDDHDYGWNNGNRRLPNKHVMKQVFLDAVGVPPCSPRRNVNHGIQWRYRLNSNHAGREIDVIMLDERYERSTLPCYVRRDWCEKEVLNRSTAAASDVAWCRDFIINGGDRGTGSCCDRDELIFTAWCQQDSNKRDARWTALCDATHESFGTINVAFDPNTRAIVDGDAAVAVGALQEPPFCDVMGSTQRRWLTNALAAATAPIKLIVSSSVMLARPLDVNNDADRRAQCSGDDWDCYKPALVSMLHTLARAPQHGCIVVLTGDYHAADIKVLRAGADTAYAAAYRSTNLSRPIWQVMASGMTTSTASTDPNSADACGGWRRDNAGLRPLGECGITVSPNFGIMDIDWDAQRVRFEIRDAATGGIAMTSGGVENAVEISLATCDLI